MLGRWGAHTRPMIFRSRLLITVAALCHLLLAPPVVTSQLLLSRDGQQESEQTAIAPPPAPANPQDKSEDVTIRAQKQEKDNKVFRLTGDVEIYFRSFVLRADRGTYDSETGVVTANGHVTLDGGPYEEHIKATHGTYNVKTDTGVFYNAQGTVGFKPVGTKLMLTSSNPFAFTGKIVRKTAPDHYVVSHGSVTSCQLPNPKWTLRSSKVDVSVGEKAVLKKSSFWVGGVPVFFLPYSTHPVQREPRQSGFLTPEFGTSSVKGFILGDGFYWAINRSMDLTVGAEMYSSRGWGERMQFRALPSQNSYVYSRFYAVQDRGIGTPPRDQGGQDAQINAGSPLPYDFRGVLQFQYLSSYLFRLAWNELYTAAISSEVQTIGFASRTRDGYSLNIMGSRYQDFLSFTPGDEITILHLPSFEASSVDRKIGDTPFYWTFQTALEGVSRHEPAFQTGGPVGRFDVEPRASLPEFLHGWTLRPEVGVRDTAYTQRLVENGAGLRIASDDPINRKAFEGSFELRPPALEKIFKREIFGQKLKHVIEPRVVYRYVTGVNNFNSFVRFDDRDVLSDTNEVEYGFVTRLYAKSTSTNIAWCRLTPRVSPFPSVTDENIDFRSPRQEEEETNPVLACPAVPQAREIATWEVAQKYFFDPTFGGAVIPGQPNVLTTTVQFAGVSFLTEPRYTSPIVSRFRVQNVGLATDVEWDLQYDTKHGAIDSSNVFVNYRLGRINFGASDFYLQIPAQPTLVNGILTPAPPARFHQFRILTSYGDVNRRGINVAGTVGFDELAGFLQYAAFQANYNFDCCGIVFEFRRFALGPVRNDNQFRFAFNLANVGAFGNVRRQERVF
jgi:LPS-assembly protein